jgi:hypothetical protein
LKFEHVIEVVSIVKFIRSHGPLLSLFFFFFGRRFVTYRSPMCESWDSAEPFSSFEARSRNVGEVVAEFSDEKWLWDLALLCDTSYHSSELNIRLQMNRSPFLICLGLSELLKRSWKCFGNSWKALTSVISPPEIYYLKMDQ